MNAVSHKKVKKLRLDNGWSQDQLARITGLSYRTIQRIEKNGHCSLDSKMALLSAFGISFHELSSKATDVLDRLFSLRFVFDGAGNYTSLVTIDPEMLVVPQAQIIGENFTTILPPELSKQILTSIADLKSGSESVEFGYSLVLNAGTQFFRSKMVQTGVDSFLSVVTEIDEQKVSEKKSFRHDALLNKVADTLKSGAWEVDLATNDILWTKQVFAIYELDKTPTITEGLSFFAPNARPIIQQAFEKLSASGEAYDLELPFISAKVKNLWVRVIGWAEYNNAQITKLSGIVQDITHLRTPKIQPSF
jgi:transcriptional regulator with XRE-family HTH domain